MSDKNDDLSHLSSYAVHPHGEYLRHAHRMQSGVAFETKFRLENGSRDQPTEPKHLRVGINALNADMAGLVALLISKGVFTSDEYVQAITKSMADEAERYEYHLSQLLGTKVTLG